MQNQFFNFEDDESLSGFRLKSLEVLNWGTFSNKIWKIVPSGKNSLLTGDIGSGKSTLVDALTTLLVPHQKITYNKAAGSDKKERNLYSYIRGEYKSEKDNLSRLSKSVFLRDKNNYSVLLGIFFNKTSGENISLAQVFYIKGETVEKFFIIGGKELGIGADFSRFGSDILELRKRLRKEESVEIYDSFKDYSIQFRKNFGLKSEKALDLLYQTVSMKSVGNLDDFVRNQMLERPDVKNKISELIQNFKNLTTTHNAVLKARKQQDFLIPLIKTSDKFEKITAEILHLQRLLESLPSFSSSKKIEILSKEIKEMENKKIRLDENLLSMSSTIEALREKEKDLSFALQNDRIGQRIREIDRELGELLKDKKRLTAVYDHYIQLAETLSLVSGKTEEAFYACREQSLKKKEILDGNFTEINKDLDSIKIRLNLLESRLKDLEEELFSLKSRKTKIPFKNLTIRKEILNALSLSEEELPFVGELVMVEESEKEWEGVIERVLHNFGLSLIVPENLYKRVAAFVNKTDIKGRLVFFRIPETLSHAITTDTDHSSLINKLRIKEDTKYYKWIYQSLLQRFSYKCCDSMEDFYHNANAITKEGLIKSGKSRHEKDDRRNIGDSRSFILGWSNLSKIRSLETMVRELKTEKGSLSVKRKNLEKDISLLLQQRQDLSRFLEYKQFSEINWMIYSENIQKLNEEKHKLESSSDKLKSLKEEHLLVLEEIKGSERQKDLFIGHISKIEERIENSHSDINENTTIMEILTESERLEYYPIIEKDLNGKIDNIALLNQEISRIASSLGRKKTASQEGEKKLRGSIVREMQKYIGMYPDETFETDASVDSIPDFRQFLRTVKEDDLPRFEKRFKKMLNEGSIHDIALFKNYLEGFAGNIKKSIKEINNSLRTIEYNTGTYIELQIDNAMDIDIRNFNNEIRDCLGNIQGEKDIYNDLKFQQVKNILTRFESSESADIYWTAKVTDVRNWFTFTASERWQEDDSEKEFYSNSAGKSGGQKEKLAYTILASALAYQFNLEQNKSHLRTFRFVVIDEAFGRGSDESTRYGLELFKKLNLQLLIVTPLQKVNIIEEYINTVHLVTNISGQESKIRNIPIKEYKEEKQKYEKKGFQNDQS